MKNPFSIAIHGGAGTLLKGQMTTELEKSYTDALELALERGYGILEAGGSALDAVEMAVSVLEDSPLFNAGKGSVFTANGTHEMDAAIMCGRSLEAGAVSLVEGVRNPIRLARTVMDASEVFPASSVAWKTSLLRPIAKLTRIRQFPSLSTSAA